VTTAIRRGERAVGASFKSSASMLRIMPKPLVSDVGHIVVPVREMNQSLRFYRDLLGFTVEGKKNAAWTVIAMKGVRLTLYRPKDFLPVALGPAGDGTPFLFHVKDFGKAAEILKVKGVRVKREGKHSGVIWDPSGNALGLHDHLESDA